MMQTSTSYNVMGKMTDGTSSTAPSLKITAPSTPSLLAFAKFKEREAMGSPTSPGMSSMTLPARKELAEAAAFRASSFHDDSSSPDDEDAGNDDDSDDSDMPRDCKANTGRWTDAEHKLFLKGLECFPYRAWKKIATLIKTRSVVQIRTHAQKYYQKLAKEEAKGKDRSSVTGHITADAANHFMHSNAAVASSAFASSSTDSTDHCANTRQKGALNSMKKRKFSFDEGHYTTTAASRLSKRKDVTLPPLGFASVDTSKLVDNNLMRPTVAATAAIEFEKPSSRSSTRQHAMMPLSSVTRRQAMTAFEVPTMILDYPASVDDKPLDEYDIIDESLSRMTPVNDEDMLHLTDEDWFSSSSENDRDAGNKNGMDDSCSPLSSPSHQYQMLSLKKSHNAFLYCDTSNHPTDATTPFDLLEPETDPYSILFDHADEPQAVSTYADEFILDPQTFLTSYFGKEG
ncbi:hypothetical protein DYB34_010709 [Aphanomyces astaci]|uniref:Uncharacterized protein n=1 Tax=Aphanomyces astaci TaxID=112090 RepID=A0A3R6WA62_APHAT|nr:hypothetical protein DYB34_010709 [Aphanomyces astaci]